ncbi:group II intron maturase-specific domain-containing protein, partial [Phocaeicola vulgatus]
MKAKLKMLTRRSNGMGYDRRKGALHKAIRAWVSYFKYAEAKTSL